MNSQVLSSILNIKEISKIGNQRFYFDLLKMVVSVPCWTIALRTLVNATYFRFDFKDKVLSSNGLFLPVC